jgi:uncharacterized protein (TIGR04255 family)
VVFKTLSELHPKNKYIRLGLRKINVINLPEETSELQDFNQYLIDFFTSHLDKKIFDSTLREDIHKLVIPDKDSHELILQYSTRTAILNDKKVRQFFLDVDYSADKNIDDTNVESTLDLLNKKIFNVYHWATKEKLREELRK